MKKFLVAVLSVMLVLSFAVVASAETEMSFYLDLLASGTVSESLEITGLGSASGSGPMTGMAVGGDFVFDNIVAGLEYDSLSGAASDTMLASNTTVLNLKGGYRILANDQFTLDAIASYLSVAFSIPDTSGKMDLTGLLIGAQGAFNISEQISVGGSVQFSVSANATSNGTEFPGDVSLMLFNLKGTYNIMDNLGITLGYRSNSSTLDYAGAFIQKDTQSGLTLGVVYTMQ